MGSQDRIGQTGELKTMYFESLASLIHMDGHGVFVWAAYGIGVLIIAYNIISPLRARKRILSQVLRQVRSSRSRDRSLTANRRQSLTADRKQKMTITRQREDRVNIEDQGVREGEVE